MNEQDRYNTWFREMAERHCPELFARIEEREGQGQQYLVGVVLNPHDAEKNIHVSTLRCELTPFCWTFHTHFPMSGSGDDEEAFQDFLDWIRGLMQDEIVITTRYRGKRETGGGCAPMDHEPEVGDDDTRIEVASWSGNLDRVIERDDREPK